MQPADIKRRADAALATLKHNADQRKIDEDCRRARSEVERLTEEIRKIELKQSAQDKAAKETKAASEKAEKEQEER